MVGSVECRRVLDKRHVWAVCAQLAALLVAASAAPVDASAVGRGTHDDRLLSGTWCRQGQSQAGGSPRDHQRVLLLPDLRIPFVEATRALESDGQGIGLRPSHWHTAPPARRQAAAGRACPAPAVRSRRSPPRWVSRGPPPTVGSPVVGGGRAGLVRPPQSPAHHPAPHDSHGRGPRLRAAHDPQARPSPHRPLWGSKSWAAALTCGFMLLFRARCLSPEDGSTLGALPRSYAEGSRAHSTRRTHHADGSALFRRACRRPG